MARPPLEITQELLEKAEQYAMCGLTQQQIASALGIGESTLYEKKANNEEFADAIKRGKSKGIALVASELVKNAKKGNVSAQIFFLKSQGGWKEAEKEIVDSAKSLIQAVIDKL